MGILVKGAHRYHTDAPLSILKTSASHICITYVSLPLGEGESILNGCTISALFVLLMYHLRRLRILKGGRFTPTSITSSPVEKGPSLCMQKEVTV